MRVEIFTHQNVSLPHMSRHTHYYGQPLRYPRILTYFYIKNGLTLLATNSQWDVTIIQTSLNPKPDQYTPLY